MLAAQKRHRLWSVLSLWALLALAMPQLLWACPMTAQAGSTSSHACCCNAQKAGAPAENSSEMQMQQCCDRVPMPASDTSGHDQSGSISLTEKILFSLPHFFVAPVLFAASAFELAPPISQTAVFPASNSPSLIPQHCPASHAGRAPPL